MNVPGYEIGHEILRTGAFAVVRGRRDADRRPVLLKVPARAVWQPSDADALEREFDLLNSLQVAGVPRAIELVRRPSTIAIVLEDRGLVPLNALRGDGPRDLAVFFRVARALCAVLADVHGRDLVIGAISPVTTLVGGERDVELADWSLAARSALARPTPLTALAGGAAPYTSPEQTGRINRAIDHRADLYALGATLYEVLTGAPPFSAEDWLELIHAHLAKAPVPPTAVDPSVPEQVSRVVMRLLAKAAEDRYQSAVGLARDLEACEREWTTAGTVRLFALGTSDVSDRFLVPQRLYGRERELAELTAAFEDTCAGACTLMLVSGYSGIGKSSLISELYRPIVRQRGHFAAGKVDQVVRGIPYGALIQAFRSLVWQLLTESEERLSAWRARLAPALGGNGGVLVEVIPELEFVIGRQPVPTVLDPAEAQNRFRYVFQGFVGSFTQESRPLVVFLDDLQWADAATLDLLQALLTAPEVRHLMVVGAYRDNEVGPGHPLALAIERIGATTASVRRLQLGPLSHADLVPFLGATLHAAPAEIDPLARLVLQKTDGNPFFVIQFLDALHREGLFEFDHQRNRWTFRMEAIAAAGLTDNVVDLMTRKIRRLTPRAQGGLMLAACLGSPFEWETFQTVSRESAGEATGALAELLDAGLLVPARLAHQTPDERGAERISYGFLHDRVQQAAYDLIPEERRAPMHLQVGRLLLARFGAEVPDERLFEVVNHLDVGSRLISDWPERLDVARLNLSAARKAKSSAAYQSAAGYAVGGLAVLGGEAWDRDHELSFALHLEAAECHYLSGRFDAADRSFELLLARAASPLDRAQVHSLRTVLYENLSRYPDAVASGREGLALFGISFPARPEDAAAALDAEIDAIGALLGGRPIASLIDLPAMADPGVRMVMRILTSMWAPSYLAGDELLTRLISATMVRLSLANGNTGDSAYGYVTHAITIGPVRRDYAAAYEWGQLALKVNERFDDKKRRAKIHQQFHAHVNLWRRPLETCIPHAREARKSGLETGDFTYAGYGAVTESWPAFLVSTSLDHFVRDHTPTLSLLRRIRMADFHAALRVMLNWALALQGRTASPLVLNDDDFDEAAFEATYQRAPFFLMFLFTARLQLAVLFGDFGRALEAARRAREVSVVGTIWPVLVDFWGGLAAAGACDTADGVSRLESSQALARSEALLKPLSDSCPENFRGWWLLLSAERARLDGRAGEGERLRVEAVSYAKDVGSVQQEAIAHDVGARAWRAAGRPAEAAACAREARRCFAAWGATAKVRQLEELYAPRFDALDAAPASAPTAVTLPARFEPASLDMATVLRIGHAIAVEIELEELLRKLMRIALQHAGADRGLFLQERDGTLLVEAEAVADPEQVTVMPSVPLDRYTEVPHSVARYVRRTGQDVVVGNACADERFAADPYVARGGVRSILCVPVVHQGRLAGMLYLENRLTTEAFTPERAEMTRIVAAQAGISLENARLYERMKDEIERRTSAEQALREALTELEDLKNRLEVENVYLQEEIRTQHNFNEIVGNSPALLEALRKVERVAPGDTTVLIVGETGSGKELFARAIHSRSRRSDRPLVKVNCGAIAPGLVESELFGHVKGAFTGAIDRRVGRFEVANGGTIFLDEVGELPLDAQVKLLRVLQEQEFEPVGSSRTVRVDVRVIAATNRNLEHAVREGTFRPDLLYRLNVFPIEVPPLRQRRSDLGLLVGFFMTGLTRKLGRPLHGFSARSMEHMLAYSWPGNVRELQNVVERAAILASGPVLELEAGLQEGPAPAGATLVPPDASTLDDVQRAHILNVLKQTGGVVEGARGAATILGVHPNTLRSRMKKLKISGGGIKAS